MKECVLTNAQVVLVDQVLDGTVVVRDGLIADVSDGRSKLTSALDCERDFLMPGLVELHTDNMERHMMPRPGSDWPVEAATINHDRDVIAAGITTVLDALCLGAVMPASVRRKLVTQFPEALDGHRTLGALRAEHFLHLRCEVSDEHMIDWLREFVDRPDVRLISVMDHTPGQRQFASIDKYAEYYQGKFNLSDEQLQKFMSERRANQEKHSALNRAMVVATAKRRGVALASHDDATYAHVDEAVRDEMCIAEFPTTVEAAEASHSAGMAVLMGGPNIVRGQSHSGNVSARELGRLGYLDVISSDYVPSSLIYAALLLAETCDNVSLPEAVKTVTRTPAEYVGLNDRGQICKGLRADLVRVRASKPVPVVGEVWRQGERVA